LDVTTEEDFIAKGNAIIRYFFKEEPEKMNEKTWAQRYNEAIYMEQWRLRNFAKLFKEN
jgi:hypothetical protein